MAGLRESPFINRLNVEILEAWFGLRNEVDTWKSDPGESAWSKLRPSTPGELDNATVKPAWSLSCGTLANCIKPSTRYTSFLLLENTEIGCFPQESPEPAQSNETSGEHDIEKLGVTAIYFNDLLRAVSYVESDVLERWDAQFAEQRLAVPGMGRLGDFEYEKDAMHGPALSDDLGPLDDMKFLDGANTRAESVLALTAAAPQVVTTTGLAFVFFSIQDLLHRLSEGNQSQMHFWDHIRAVEDLSLNDESADMLPVDMDTRDALKRSWHVRENEYTGIFSVTRRKAQVMAGHHEQVAQESFDADARRHRRKAAFYRRLASDVDNLPPNFRSISYMSPATERIITRLFMPNYNGEGGASPIAYGNMLETSLTEFFHHVDGMSKSRKLFQGLARALTGGGFQNGETTDSEEISLCCCKNRDQCELLGPSTGLVRSLNPLRGYVCPSNLGYHRYTHSAFGHTTLPLACKTFARD